jgi:hypothetical protein
MYFWEIGYGILQLTMLNYFFSYFLLRFFFFSRNPHSPAQSAQTAPHRYNTFCAGHMYDFLHPQGCEAGSKMGENRPHRPMLTPTNNFITFSLFYG